MVFGGGSTGSFFFERLFPPSNQGRWNPQIVEGIGGHFHRSTGSRVWGLGP